MELLVTIFFAIFSEQDTTYLLFASSLFLHETICNNI